MVFFSFVYIQEKVNSGKSWLGRSSDVRTYVPVGLFSVVCVCVFVGLYFLRTKIKIALTRCHILRLKCTTIDFFWGSAYSAPRDLLAGFKGPYF